MQFQGMGVGTDFQKRPARRGNPSVAAWLGLLLLSSGCGAIRQYETSPTGCLDASLEPYETQARINCPSGLPLSGWELVQGSCQAGEVVFVATCENEVQLGQCGDDKSACKPGTSTAGMAGLVGDCTLATHVFSSVYFKPCGTASSGSLQYLTACCPAFTTKAVAAPSTVDLQTDCSKEVNDSATLGSLSTFKNPVLCPEGTVLNYMRMRPCSPGFRYDYSCRQPAHLDTRAPPTGSPPTAAPATAAPATGAPGTAAPDTPAPDTSAPMTLGPALQTRAPGTLVDGPRTDSPSTVASLVSGVPDTSEPATAAPRPKPKPLSPKAQASAEYAAVGAAVSGASGMSALRLVVMSQDCKASPDPDIPRSLHPLHFKIDGSTALGAVFGNLLLAVGLLATYDIVIVHIIGRVVRHVADAPPPDFRGAVRFPSLPLLVLLFLYQGTAWGAFLLVFQPSGAVHTLVGAGTIIFCSIIPVWVLRQVHDGVGDGQRKAVYRVDSRTKAGSFVNFLAGSGEWVSARVDDKWVFRYSSLMLTYREDRAYWGAIDMLASLALAATGTLPVVGNVACGHVKMVSASVIFLLLLAEIKCLPHHRSRDNVTSIAVLALQTVEVSLLGLTAYADDPEHWSAVAAGAFVFGIVAIFGVKAAFDVAAEVWVLAVRRRETLQHEQWKEAGDASTALLTPSTPPTRAPVRLRKLTKVFSQVSLDENLLFEFDDCAPMTPSQSSVSGRTPDDHQPEGFKSPAGPLSPAAWPVSTPATSGCSFIRSPPLSNLSLHGLPSPRRPPIPPLRRPVDRLASCDRNASFVTAPTATSLLGSATPPDSALLSRLPSKGSPAAGNHSFDSAIPSPLVAPEQLGAVSLRPASNRARGSGSFAGKPAAHPLTARQVELLTSSSRPRPRKPAGEANPEVGSPETVGAALALLRWGCESAVDDDVVPAPVPVFAGAATVRGSPRRLQHRGLL
ncbi:hypothetical protein DIPPA_23909 [Diplonema papillatum]|nr:hypothetical protein DIPPA_23909 [Diplonema papillatum]